MQDGARRALAASEAHRKGLTERWPPPEVPTPFSGTGPMIGSATTGSVSSGNGGAPLFAVIVSCLFVLLVRGRSHFRSTSARPGTVPCLALERPG